MGRECSLAMSLSMKEKLVSPVAMRAIVQVERFLNPQVHQITRCQPCIEFSAARIPDQDKLEIANNSNGQDVTDCCSQSNQQWELPCLLPPGRSGTRHFPFSYTASRGLVGEGHISQVRDSVLGRVALVVTG